MKYKSSVKKMLAMLCAAMFIVANMSMAFASDESVIGWPTDGATYTSGAENSNDGVVGPELDSQSGITEASYGKSDISAGINLNTTADSAGDQLASNIYAQYSDTLPDVSIDDLVEWSNRKGFEIIKFLQTFIQPFAIIIFMIGAIMVLVGSIGNSQISGKGFMGMVMSVLCYCGCLYAPSILSTLVAWLGS